MLKHYFKKSEMPTPPAHYNRGNIVEWYAGCALTGEPSKANNKPAEAGGDVGTWQIKSPKASLTGRDNCKGYIFGFADTDFFYEMTIAEFENFVNEFSYTDRDSRSKKEKIRISGDSKRMRKWLEDRA